MLYMWLTYLNDHKCTYIYFAIGFYEIRQWNIPSVASSKHKYVQWKMKHVLGFIFFPKFDWKENICCLRFCLKLLYGNVHSTYVYYYILNYIHIMYTFNMYNKNFEWFFHEWKLVFIHKYLFLIQFYHISNKHTYLILIYIYFL